MNWILVVSEPDGLRRNWQAYPNKNIILGRWFSQIPPFPILHIGASLLYFSLVQLVLWGSNDNGGFVRRPFFSVVSLWRGCELNLGWFSNLPMISYCSSIKVFRYGPALWKNPRTTTCFNFHVSGEYGPMESLVSMHWFLHQVVQFCYKVWSFWVLKHLLSLTALSSVDMSGKRHLISIWQTPRILYYTVPSRAETQYHACLLSVPFPSFPHRVPIN